MALSIGGVAIRTFSLMMSPSAGVKVPSPTNLASGLVEDQEVPVILEIQILL